MMLAKSLQSAAGNAAEANYIEDVFSTYLYTGNGSTQTITNGIDLAGEGGLVWTKCRSLAEAHMLFDTERGIYNRIFSNSTNAQSTSTNTLTAFNSDGFSIGDNNIFNTSGSTNVSWTFRKQPKFFDVVTYTGNGGTQQNIPHNLGSSPNCIIVKRTDAAGDWYVAPMMLSNWNNDYLVLNSTAAKVSSSDIWQGTSGKSSTTFGVLDGSTVNISGATYVAYLFAHDAGGFGLSGEDNVISCGSFTNSGSTVDVNLGYEAQFVLMKKSSGTGNWFLFDTMRGMAQTSFEFLYPNLSGAAEFKDYQGPFATATGFSFNPANNGQFTTGDYIYIAIRRGPMAVPTDGTSVFLPSTYTGSNSVNQVINTGFTVDMTWARARNAANSMEDYDRLRGNTVRLSTDLTDAEISSTALYFDLSNSVSLRAGYNLNYSTLDFIAYNFARAPSVFDVVCYTGTGVARTVAHNLTVVPELMIIKSRSTGYGWTVYAAGVGNTSFAYLNEPDGFQVNSTAWNNTSPTNSVFTVGTGPIINASGSTFVAYLFASCPGVSKVGSYTGTGATQQINCGFTGGARFVLIKRTDSTGDWYVWDSARGIVAGNDSYLLLNSTAAEVTSTDYIDTYSAGFEISSTAPAAINASGGTFLFLAVA